MILVLSCIPKALIQVPESFKEIVDPMAHNSLISLAKQDYKGFGCDFDANMQKVIIKQDFIELRKLLWGQFGAYQSAEYQKAVEK